MATWAVATVAWSGLILGHVVAYVLAYPLEGTRHAHLLATGHGSFGLLALAGLVAVPVALVLSVAHGLAGRDDLSVRGTALRLAAVQTAGFLLLEVAERHLSVAAALSDPAVLIGVVVQIVVAVAGALLLVFLVRGARSLVGRQRRTRRAPAALPPRLGPSLPPRLTFLEGIGRRAPPTPASA